MQITFDKGFSAHFDKTHERFLHILSVIFFAFLKTVGPIEIQTDVVLYNLIGSSFSSLSGITFLQEHPHQC
jgi:hypothetical protein